MENHADEPSLAPETLDLIFQLVRDTPERQLRAVDSLDGKIVQVFAAGGVLIGLAAVGSVKRGALTAVLVGIAVVAFLYIAAHTVSALWARRFRVSISPDQLWERYWLDTPEAIKHAFVADVASGYVENDGYLKAKRSALTAALIGLGVEAVAIGVALTASAA